MVRLPRAATDREWQVLVTELRETFGARGEVTSHGGIREWTNGNLHAFLEPTESGHRLRLGTHKNGTTAVTAIGAVSLVVLVVLAVEFAINVGIVGAGTMRAMLSVFIPSLLAVAGGGNLAWHHLRLRRWANEREQQMEHIAGRARALLAAPPLENEGEP